MLSTSMKPTVWLTDYSEAVALTDVAELIALLAIRAHPTAWIATAGQDNASSYARRLANHPLECERAVQTLIGKHGVNVAHQATAWRSLILAVTFNSQRRLIARRADGTRSIKLIVARGAPALPLTVRIHALLNDYPAWRPTQAHL